ncbi:MAG: DUF2887 domain-containing protein, partial [Coleofasciculus sp. C2-GNP5-27]
LYYRIFAELFLYLRQDKPSCPWRVVVIYPTRWIDLIETIIVYKLPQKSREEIEGMLGLSELKQTKVYQEAKQEGLDEGQLKAKLEAIPRMMQLGLNLEMIAEGLDLPLDVVQPAAQSFSQQNVAAFMELLTHQRELFSPQDLANLAELIKPLPDKIENLSDAIAQWCKQEGYLAQLQAWRHVLSGLWAATVEQWLARNLESFDTPSAALNKAMLQQAIESESSN